jgi:hypothetical protein
MHTLLEPKQIKGKPEKIEQKVNKGTDQVRNMNFSSDIDSQW